MRRGERGGREERGRRGGSIGGLVRLGETREWRIPENEPDIRGWEVDDRDDDTVGEIEDVLIDEQSGRAEFIAVRYGGALGMGGKTTLVPSNKVRLDFQDKVAYLNGTDDELHSAPQYDEDVRDYSAFRDYWSGEGVDTRERRERTHRDVPEAEPTPGARAPEAGVGVPTPRPPAEAGAMPAAGRTMHVYRRDISPGREVQPGEQILQEGEVLVRPVIEEHLEIVRGDEVVGELVIQYEHPEEEPEPEEQEADRPRARSRRR